MQSGLLSLMRRKFNNPLEGDILNFQQGVFYKVIIASLLTN
jgi:hypothetical protein